MTGGWVCTDPEAEEDRRSWTGTYTLSHNFGQDGPLVRRPRT